MIKNLMKPGKRCELRELVLASLLMVLLIASFILTNAESSEIAPPPLPPGLSPGFSAC